MKKPTDLRRLKADQLTEFRRQVVNQIQSGVSVDAIVESLGVSRRAVFNWLSAYRNQGMEGLDANKRGGRKPKLSGEAMGWVYDIVTNKQPDQMKLEFALWTASLVAEAIKQQWGITLSRWSVSRLLKQMGLSPQRPLRRAYQQDAERVDRWKAEELPAIQAQAKKDGGQIWYLDESAVKSTTHSGTTWAPVGETPIVKSTGARFSLNMIGAISARGEFRFKTYKGTLDSAGYISFLKRLVRDLKLPVLHLVVDGHPVHRSKAVKNYVAGLDGRLVIHVLPPYSPELNPIEQVWNHVKTHQVGKKMKTGPKQLKSIVLRALRRLQKTPAIIGRFFDHPECGFMR